MLVHGAALDEPCPGHSGRQRLFETRRAVDDDQLRRRQSTPDEIVEQRAPGRLAFSAHALDRQQHLLAVGARRVRSATDDRGRPSSSRTRATVPSRIKPHDRLFGERARIPGDPVALRVSAPDAADHVLADRPSKHRVQRAAHAAGGVGPCKISPGDQGVSGSGAALVSAQRTAPPFARLAVSPAGQPSARHGDPRLAKRARQRPLAMPVAHANNRWRRLVSRPGRRPWKRTRQRLGKFLLQHRLDKAARPSPNSPSSIASNQSSKAKKLRRPGRLLRGILRHGVVSVPARQRRNHLG